MFNACDEAVLNALYERVIHMCKDSNSYVLILVKLMEKRKKWTPYLIDQVKGTFGLRKSSFSESNHLVIFFLLLNTQRVCVVQYQS